MPSGQGELDGTPRRSIQVVPAATYALGGYVIVEPVSSIWASVLNRLSTALPVSIVFSPAYLGAGCTAMAEPEVIRCAMASSRVVKPLPLSILVFLSSVYSKMWS